MAVAAVVLNRVRSSSFPNTVSGVIYQPGAFTEMCIRDRDKGKAQNNAKRGNKEGKAASINKSVVGKTSGALKDDGKSNEMCIRDRS